MKIILKEDITGLGYKDDVVEVKDGYGRNYLIPQGKAVIATASAMKVLEENQRQRAHKLAKLKADAEATAEALKDVKLTIGAKTSSTGTIFGSVNSIQIAEKKLYEGNATGKIPDKHFNRLLVEYDTEQSELELEAAGLKEGITAQAEDGMRAQRFVSLVRRYTSFDELTAPCLMSL